MTHTISSVKPGMGAQPVGELALRRVRRKSKAKHEFEARQAGTRIPSRDNIMSINQPSRTTNNLTHLAVGKAHLTWNPIETAELRGEAGGKTRDASENSAAFAANVRLIPFRGNPG